jgi:hypothetical protein
LIYAQPLISFFWCSFFHQADAMSRDPDTQVRELAAGLWSCGVLQMLA